MVSLICALEALGVRRSAEQCRGGENAEGAGARRDQEGELVAIGERLELARVLRTAMPKLPPTRRLVLTTPAARPFCWNGTPLTATIVAGTSVQPVPSAASMPPGRIAAS
jgi:hypothetical protein